jgi:cyclophilin family peptidyl-prolyl cis-trans isomerase
MRFSRHVIAALLCVGTLAACGSSSSGSSDKYGAGTTAPLASTPATSAPATGGLGTNPAAAGVCAKADGSSPKTMQFTAAPPNCLDAGKTYIAEITTNFGVVHVTLNADVSPLTVNNFVNLARFHYFDGTTCHRAIKTFVVQCGDPTATGSGGPGYSFPDELTKLVGYHIGSVAMANSGPDTNGSQFFLITGDSGAQLPPKYNLVGDIDQNDFSVLQALDAVANPQDGPPLKPIDITSITITER